MSIGGDVLHPQIGQEATSVGLPNIPEVDMTHN